MWLERYNHNQVKIFRETKHTYCKKKALSTGKLTIAVISGCHLYFYSVRFGKKCDVLKKLLMAKGQLRMHTDTLRQALPGRPPSSPYGGGGGGGAATFLV
jgi:hypothetical protein